MRRYVIAAIIGIAIGLAAILTVASFGSDGFEGFDTWWSIPNFDWNATPGPKEQLQNQAILLRACHIFIEHGLVYLSWPLLFTLGLAKLDEVGARRPIARKLSFSLQVTIYSSIAIAAVHDAGPRIPTAEGVFFTWWYETLFLLVVAWGGLLGPVVVIIVFLLTMFSRPCERLYQWMTFLKVPPASGDTPVT